MPMSFTEAGTRSSGSFGSQCPAISPQYETPTGHLLGTGVRLAPSWKWWSDIGLVGDEFESGTGDRGTLLREASRGVGSQGGAFLWLWTHLVIGGQVGQMRELT
jgi:hypothetical protein